MRFKYISRTDNQPRLRQAIPWVVSLEPLLQSQMRLGLTSLVKICHLSGVKTKGSDSLFFVVFKKRLFLV